MANPHVRSATELADDGNSLVLFECTAARFRAQPLTSASTEGYKVGPEVSRIQRLPKTRRVRLFAHGELSNVERNARN